MDDDADWERLPTIEKVQHNIWKVRLTGYEEAIKLFKTLGDVEIPEFTEFSGLLTGFVTDVNAIAQQKGLEAVQVFVANAKVAPEKIHEVVEAIIKEGLSSHRERTRELCREVIIRCVEAGYHVLIEENLLSGLLSKNTKVVTGCLTCLREALRDFGSEVMDIEPITKCLPPLMKHTSPPVREETEKLFIEMYRWTGPTCKLQMLSGLATSQAEKLEKEFESMSNDNPVPVKFSRAQKDLKAKIKETSSVEDSSVAAAEMKKS